MSYDFAIDFHHEIELRDEIGVGTEAVEHEMLGAPGAIDIPECLAGEVFHFAVVLRLFEPDCYIAHSRTIEKISNKEPKNSGALLPKWWQSNAKDIRTDIVEMIVI